MDGWLFSKWCSWTGFSDPFSNLTLFSPSCTYILFTFHLPQLIPISHLLNPFYILSSSYFCFAAVINPKLPTALLSAFPLDSSHLFLHNCNSYLNSFAGCQQLLKAVSNFSPALLHSSKHNISSNGGLFLYKTKNICQSSRNTPSAEDVISSPLQTAWIF